MTRKPHVMTHSLELHTRPSELEKLEADLRTAHEVQLRLLGVLPPSLAFDAGGIAVEARIASAYQPAEAIGGDFYHLVRLSQNRLLASVGDASGAGVAAALVMVRAITELHTLVTEGRPPASILAEANRRISRGGHDESFVTALCIDIDMMFRTLRIANAGHVPVLIRRADGELVRLGEHSGVPLGMLPVEHYDQDDHHFDLGDILILMTDGISEALDRAPATSRLDRAIARADHDPEAIVDSLLYEVAQSGAHPDDRTLLAVQLGDRVSVDPV